MGLNESLLMYINTEKPFINEGPVFFFIIIFNSLNATLIY